MAQLTCENLSLGYEGTEIVSGLNFTVSAGDYLCVVGENGSGKSTLVKTILGLTAPVSGRVIWGDGLTRTEIGYLPQQTAVQRDFPASVWEIVLSGCLSRNGFRPFYSAEDRKTAMRNLERLGLAASKDKCYRDLSGGQQQRVLLARALCATQRLLLLDEPVSGLDPVVTAELYRLIESLNQEGITVVMISHDIPSAVRYASHILHIGKAVFFGTAEEYRKSSLYSRFAEAEG